tara:strand:- start:578 stop:826 length:249 start_codon:yes stop_codon:yes gene_type:complete
MNDVLQKEGLQTDVAQKSIHIKDLVLPPLLAIVIYVLLVVALRFVKLSKTMDGGIKLTALIILFVIVLVSVTRKVLQARQSI